MVAVRLRVVVVIDDVLDVVADERIEAGSKQEVERLEVILNVPLQLLQFTRWKRKRETAGGWKK